jgi:hypothetical protein
VKTRDVSAPLEQHPNRREQQRTRARFPEDGIAPGVERGPRLLRRSARDDDNDDVTRRRVGAHLRRPRG